MSDFDYIATEWDDTIFTIAIDRPDALNALNPAVLAELQTAVGAASEHADVDAVILTGSGRAFVAGADIKAMVEFTPAQAREFSELGHATFDAIAALEVPVLAAINGFALGGGLELALACDLLYGSEGAKLGLPEVGLGVIPGWGGTQRLGRTVGWHAARELIFTGKVIGAHEAKEIGLLRDVFAPDELLDSVASIAAEIASNGPLAVRAAKRAMYTGADVPLSDGLDAEQKEFGELFGTADQSEGMKAYLDKRDPEFTRS